jgi:hypothetical protein
MHRAILLSKCVIDPHRKNIFRRQQSLNSMVDWRRHRALTHRIHRQPRLVYHRLFNSKSGISGTMRATGQACV